MPSKVIACWKITKIIFIPTLTPCWCNHYTIITHYVCRGGYNPTSLLMSRVGKITALWQHASGYNTQYVVFPYASRHPGPSRQNWPIFSREPQQCGPFPLAQGHRDRPFCMWPAHFRFDLTTSDLDPCPAPRWRLRYDFCEGLLEQETQFLCDVTEHYVMHGAHIEAETKWPPFPRRYFQMHFPELKCINFD